MVRYLVLGLLRTGVVLHGYAIVRAFEERSGMRLNGGNFYRELQRLVAEGLICQVTNPSGADPRRTPYAITESGAVEFDAWFGQVDDESGPPLDDGFSLRALFIDAVDPLLARQLLDRWGNALWLRTKNLERDREATKLWSQQQPRVLPVRASVVDRRLRQTAAELEALDEFRRTYDTWLTETQFAGVAAASAKADRRVVRPRRRR